MHPGALIHAVSEHIANFTGPTGTFKYDIWSVGTVVACRRSTLSSTPWVNEKTGEANHHWPMEMGWECTVLVEDRIVEWLLEDADRDKTWQEVLRVD